MLSRLELVLMWKSARLAHLPYKLPCKLLLSRTSSWKSHHSLLLLVVLELLLMRLLLTCTRLWTHRRHRYQRRRGLRMMSARPWALG